jgi:hypothetical protein
VIIARLLLSLAYARLVGGLISWHRWRSRRTSGAQRLRHAMALARLAELSDRQARRWQGAPAQTHQHEAWQLAPSASGGTYCRACGAAVAG